MYTKTERERIGQEIYEGEYTVASAAARYDISFYTARMCLRTYKAQTTAQQFVPAEEKRRKKGREIYQKAEREKIGREIYEKKYTVAEASARYNISFYTARNYLRDYKKNYR